MLTIMHKNCMDAAFEVVHSHRHKPGHITLKGYWVNLGYMGKPWMLTTKAKLVIKEEDWANWINITGFEDQVRLRSGPPPKYY